MTEAKRKKIITVAIGIGIWVLVADAYWMSKVRSVNQCVLHSTTELMKNGRIDQVIMGKEIYWEECSLVEGADNYWDSFRGMAYWEVMMTLPVAYRYRFN